MYDFYPEWGPSRHRDADTASTPTRRQRYWQPTTGAPTGTRPAMAMAGADSRDGDRDRPDDN